MMCMKSKFVAGLLTAMLLVTVSSGCGKQQSAKTGDTGATLKGKVMIAGSTSIQPLSEELATAFMTKNPGVTVNIAGGGSGAGVKSAQDGTADIGACSRQLTTDEKSTVKETVIAKDGVAVIVNTVNSVKGLTVAQVKDIFSGKVTNWKDIGGKDASINIFTREEGSGTRTAFEERVMGKNTKISIKAGVQNSTGALRTAVASDTNGVSYIAMGSVDKSVKALTIDGIKPSTATVIAGTYKIQRLFLYLTKSAPVGVSKAFIDFVLSTDGQKIVGQKFVTIK